MFFLSFFSSFFFSFFLGVPMLIVSFLFLILWGGDGTGSGARLDNSCLLRRCVPKSTRRTAGCSRMCRLNGGCSLTATLYVRSVCAQIFAGHSQTLSWARSYCTFSCSTSLVDFINYSPLLAHTSSVFTLSNAQSSHDDR
jgi:hypothetical protein